MASSYFLKNISRGILSKINTIFTNPYRKINLNWFKIKYYKHLPPGEIKTHSLFGKPLFFSDSLQLIYGLEEIFVHEVYRVQLAPRPYVIDCGANIGLSVIYMKRQCPDAEIIAFEPDEKNFLLLSKNIASFGYTDVTLRKEAIWIENTELQFSSEATMTSKIEPAASSRNTIPVIATRLKDLLMRKVDFLKIDIEGAEYNVLTDISDKLHMVNNMFVEYHGTFNQNNELAEMIQIITKNGFNYYIKEAASLFAHPFINEKKSAIEYDVQLNIFCFRLPGNKL